MDEVDEQGQIPGANRRGRIEPAARAYHRHHRVGEQGDEGGREELLVSPGEQAQDRNAGQDYCPKGHSGRSARDRLWLYLTPSDCFRLLSNCAKLHNIIIVNRYRLVISSLAQGAGTEEETEHHGSDGVRQSEGRRHAYRSLPGDQPPCDGQERRGQE